MLQNIRQRQDDGLEQTLQREALAQAICYNRDDGSTRPLTHTVQRMAIRYQTRVHIS